MLSITQPNGSTVTAGFLALSDGTGLMVFCGIVHFSWYLGIFSMGFELKVYVEQLLISIK